MNVMKPEERLAELLALPASERVEIAQELLASLDPTTDPGSAEAWVAEIERRVRKVDAGAAALATWPEVRARLLARIRTR